MRHALFCLALAAAGAAAAAVPPRLEEVPAPAIEMGFAAAPEGPADEITPAERDAIWKAIDANRRKLFLPKAGQRPAFIWPLRAARGYAAPGSHRVTNYVDHDAAFPGQLRDYQCGSHTYDRDTGYNHRGIDISIWPDSWNTMALSQVEIVAAAAGTIVLKSDGNFDRNCKFDAGTWNAVYVQHDDGSIAWYGHMKTGSLTTKPVGARVAAGEYLGAVGSSGNSTGPHLHLEVYDANQRLIDPYAGSCNARNVESWWAQQPPYRTKMVNRAVTASAAPTFGTCGADGRNADPGSLNAKRSFSRGAPIVLVAAVRDVDAGDVVHMEVRQPDGRVWRTAQSAAAQSFLGAAAFWFTTTVDAQAPYGTWMLEMRLGDSKATVPFEVTPDGGPIANYTDLWWNPAESGWGVNLNHQGDTLFATWFTYDPQGAASWLVASDLRRQADGSFHGVLYRTNGTPLAQIAGRPATSAPPVEVGTATLRFEDASRGTFSYVVGGAAQSKAIQRQAFAASTTCMATPGDRVHATNYQDLWWQPSESGWGVNIAHQGETLFATWFTYGPGGAAQWLVASDVRRQPTGEFRGRLYRTTGTPLAAIAGAPATVGAPQDVGEVTFTFADGERGQLDYSVEGVVQSKAIVRQVFGATRPLCR